MSKLDLTSKLEQLEAFEERIGVSFKSLSAFLDSDNDEYITLDVRGEVHAATGTKVKNDFTVAVVVYDDNDRVIGTSEASFYSDDFFGFDTFSESVHIPIKNISKVRIYPKKG